MPRVPFLLPIATALLIGSLTACGGGDETAIDTTSPTVSSALASGEPVVKQSRFTVTGSVADDTGVQTLQLSLNGQTSTVALSSGSFTATVDLKAGRNAYTLTARDAAGNQGTLQGSVYLGQRVAAANSHAGALRGGLLHTWGRNKFGQTGLGFYSELSKNPDTHPSAPKIVSVPQGVELVAISFGQNHSAAIDAQGRLWTWGDDAVGQLGRGDGDWSDCGLSGTTARICRLDIGQVANWADVVQVSAGLSHVMVLRADGSVWAFGSNSKGALGQPADVTKSSTPVQVTWSASDVSAGAVGRIVQVVAGSAVSYALDDKGQLWAWGRNDYGNLGQNVKDSDAHPVPALVPLSFAAGSSRVVSVANGNNHTLALDDQGQVYAWGNNATSQVGFNGVLHKGQATAWGSPVLSPRQVPAFAVAPALEVYANGNTSFARRADGKVYPWGQWGSTDATGKTTYANLDEPADTLAGLVDGGASGIGGDKSIADLAVGALFSVALRNDLNVFSWGWNFESSLGGGGTIAERWFYLTPIAPVFP